MGIKFCLPLIIAVALTAAMPQPKEASEPAKENSTTYVESEGEAKETEYIEVLDLPCHKDMSFKAYMDYRTITDTSSEQYDMQQEAYTDENGMRKIDEYYCVALGTGLSDELGSRFEIELSSGQTFKAILADQKADIHTDESRRFIDLGDGRANVVEFIVHDDYLPQIVTQMGDVTHMPNEEFYGDIVSIKEIAS